MGVRGVVRFFSLFLVFLFVFLYSSICYGKMSLSQVRTYLNHSSPEIRVQGVKALGVIDDPQAVDLLISALNDVDLRVRGEAVRVLGEKRDSRAVEPLILLLNDKNLRIDAAKALGKIKDARAVEPLIRHVSREIKRNPLYGYYTVEDDFFVNAAIEALGEIGDPRAIDFLHFVAEEVVLHKTTAAEALGKIKDPKAVDILISLVDRYKSCEVARVLAEIGDPRGIDAVFSAWLDKQIGCGQLPSLLAKIRNQKVVDMFIFILNLPEENSIVRRDAILSLGEMGASFPEFRDQIVPILIQNLQRKEAKFRTETVWALGKIKDPRVIEALISVLDEEKDKVILWPTSVPVQAASYLVKLTGVNFGLNKAKWQAWWSKNKKNFMTDAVKDTVKDTTKGTTERATKTTKSSSGK